MKEIITDTKISSKEGIARIMASALNKKRSLALYQLPESGEKHLVIDFSSTPVEVVPDPDQMPPGFIISRFDNHNKAFFLKADLHIVLETRQVQVRHPEVSLFLEKLVEETSEQPVVEYWVNPNQLPDAGSDYRHLVQRSVEAIRQKKFLKVVPSRTRRQTLPDNFDLVQAFLTLCATYPTAFVSLVSLEGQGTWMGASPEILIKTSASQHFHTSAVAGTRAYQPGLPMHEVSWRQKEIEEQAMVSRYIIDCFKKIRLREFDEEGPKTARAGNLVHLRTDFMVDMQAAGFPQLGTVMLQLLHPTSAICGMPKQAAADFLHQHEGYNREFYAGYLGPVNMGNQTDIYVNIRCMQLFKNEAVLYAGAGVTRYSDPEKELQETEMKFQTMMNVLS